MKALVIDRPGDPPSLAVREVETPSPGPGDALVEVAACGLCHHDVDVMNGTLRRGIEPNVILGHEISGRIVDLGSSVTTLSVGDRAVSTLTTFCSRCDRCRAGDDYRCAESRGVGHSIDGGFAQFVCLPAASLVTVPDHIEPEAAALLACPTGVALHGLRDVARVRPGETVAVVGAGGGLGAHCLLVAAHLQAQVIAVTTSSVKADRLEALGAGDVMVADEVDVSDLVLALTQDRGVDVVVNPVGSALFDSCVRSLAQFGRMLLLGEVGPATGDVRLPELLFRDASVLGSTGAGRRHVMAAAEMVHSGDVKPVISIQMGLEEAAEAYRLMRSRESFGRIVLIPPPS